MVSIRRAGILVLPAALLLGLSGCALLEPAGSDEPPTALQQCAMGHTWTLNVDKLAEQVLAVLTDSGVTAPTVTGTGSQTFTWQLDGAVSVETDYDLAITATPAADQAITVTQTHKGTASGEIFINAEVAIPRNWDGTGHKVETTGELNGAAIEEIPFAVPATDFDDAVGIELTCDGDTLTTHPRGTAVTQTWTKAG
jgi:hypothetical protein